MQSKLRRSRVVTHTIYSDAEGYDDKYSVAWDEGQSWARFAAPEFQFTITKSGVIQLKQLVDAFIEDNPNEV
jgi:hypothetical protein